MIAVFVRIMLVTTMWHAFFFFNDTATTEIYTLSLHDALPICLRDVARQRQHQRDRVLRGGDDVRLRRVGDDDPALGRRLDVRSEEHTSELQSRQYLVCRLLLEKKKKNYTTYIPSFPIHSTTST